MTHSIFSLTLTSIIAAFSASVFAIDLGKVEADLKGAGAVGWLHGSSAQTGLYAFTVRNPENFFDYVIVSLVNSESVTRETLATFSRHDKVRIQGEFLNNRSPQKHVLVKSIELLKKFEAPTGPIPDHNYQAELPKDLVGLNQATFLVHAIAGEGRILVTEYKDVVVPIYVRNPILIKDLFRNDVVELRFKIQSDPGRPTHLRLLETEAEPIKVIESIKQKHGLPADVLGSLVLFPKSPEIIFNVFAVQELLPNGLSRQHTIVNFKDPQVFAKIREKLQTAWDQKPEHTSGRNKLVSSGVRVRVKGTFNVVDANQANPQILIESPEQISVEP
jgi:hypothetical protein